MHLVELPTGYEGNDNIIAFWNPKERPAAMQPFRFAYTIQWALTPDAKLPHYRAMQTRVGADPRNVTRRQIMVDFVGSNGDASAEAPEAIVTCAANGKVNDVQVFKNDLNKSWRAIFFLTPEDGQKSPVELSCVLKSGSKVASEVWRYRWNPLSANIMQK
jgi:periplasmic glucans biosynthesis protein